MNGRNKGWAGAEVSVMTAGRGKRDLQQRAFPQRFPLSYSSSGTDDTSVRSLYITFSNQEIVLPRTIYRLLYEAEVDSSEAEYLQGQYSLLHRTSRPSYSLSASQRGRPRLSIPSAP